MWFLEDALTPGAVFGVAGMIFLFRGLNNGIMRHVIIGGTLLIVGASAFVIDALVVTEREQIQSRVVNLCHDFQNHRASTYDYFSPTAPELKGLVGAAMELVTLESNPTLTDFRIQVTNQSTRATSHFRANATISVKGHGSVGHQPSRFILTWAREGDDWKIIRVQRMHPIQDRELGLLQQTAE